MTVDGLSRPFLDGGVAANNPASLALAKTFELGHLPPNVVLVSLGTGVSELTHPRRHGGVRRGWVGWAKPIVDTSCSTGAVSSERNSDRVYSER